MKKKLCLLLTTTMLTTCIGVAAAEDTTADPQKDPAAIVTPAEPAADKDNQQPAADATDKDSQQPAEGTESKDATDADADKQQDATKADEKAPTDEAVKTDEPEKADAAATDEDKQAPAAEANEVTEPEAAPAPITVTVDGQALAVDQAPVIQDGRTLVPLRAIFEALGAWVQWDAQTQTIVADKHLDTISLTIGDNKLNVSGKEVTLDVAAQIIDGRTMVPVRAISEAFGAKVEWDAEKAVVSVNTVQTGTHAVTDKYLYAEKKAEDGSKTLYTASAAYPILANPDNSSIITAINTAMEKTAQDYIAQAEKDFAELDADPDVISAPYTFDLRYGITYDQNGMISFCTRSVVYTGGAHPNTIMDGKTFDTTLGKELALTDVLKADQEAVNKQIIDAFTAQIEAAGEEGGYFENAKDTLTKEIAQADFYLTNEGAIVFFPLYTLQPYAAGFSTCTLPLAPAAN